MLRDKKVRRGGRSRRIRRTLVGFLWVVRICEKRAATARAGRTAHAPAAVKVFRALLSRPFDLSLAVLVAPVVTAQDAMSVGLCRSVVAVRVAGVYARVRVVSFDGVVRAYVYAVVGYLQSYTTSMNGVMRLAQKITVSV